jgi:endonuclease YncB( thermonuclease family)
MKNQFNVNKYININTILKFVMRSKNPLLIFILLLVLILPLSGRMSFLRGDLYKVTSVFDGDTIEVDMAGSGETIRLIGVDTPETNHPDIGKQCYGKQATENLQSIISNHVQLIADPKSTNRDRFDRLLRYVYTDDGVFLNLEQVKEGFGFATTGFQHSLLSLFITIETKAANNKIGLWSKCDINLDNGIPQTQQV